MSGPITMGTETDRRKVVRYQLPAPVTFKSVSKDQIETHGAGFVQDISPENVFVLCPLSPAVGDLIEIEILLPPFDRSAAKLAVTSTGYVVRVDNKSGFVVAAKFSLHRYIMGEHAPIPDEEA